METRDSPFPLICIATFGICRRFDSTCMNDCSVDGTKHNPVKLTRRCVPRLGRYSAEVTWKVALAVEPTATEPEEEREVNNTLASRRAMFSETEFQCSKPN